MVGNHLFSAYSPNWSKPCARGYCCWSQVPAAQPTMRIFVRMWWKLVLFFNVVMLNLILLWKTAKTSGFQVMGKWQPVSLGNLTMEMELQALIAAWVSCRALGRGSKRRVLISYVGTWLLKPVNTTLKGSHMRSFSLRGLTVSPCSHRVLDGKNELPCYIYRVLLFTMCTYLSCSTHSFLF